MKDFWNRSGWACPPCGGMAVGVDRLIMALLGLDHINLVQAFPAERL